MFLHNSARIFDLGFRYPVAPLDLAFPNWSRRIVGKSLVHLIEGTLLAAGTRIEYENLHWSVRPFPVFHLRQIVAVLARIMFVLRQFVSQEFLKVGTNALQFRHPMRDRTGKMKTIQSIHDSHVERGGCSALFLVAVHVEIVVTMSAIAQPMDEPGISVIGEDHWFIGGEHGIKFGIGNSVRMLTERLQGHQVHYVNDPNLEIGKMLP